MPDGGGPIPTMRLPLPREPQFAEPLPEEPAEITSAFFADYEAWNAFAMASRKLPRGMDAAARVYDALIARYCPPGKQRRGLAFGSLPAHSPASSIITGERRDGDRRVVITRTVAQESYCPVYEFDYVEFEGCWLLEEVYLVDEGERFPGL